MSTGVIVRLMRKADLQAVCDLTNWAIVNTAAHFGQEPEPVSVWQEKWTAGHEKYAWLTAELDDAFAGFAYAGVFRPRASYAWTVETSVYIRPECAGKRVGRALYDQLMAIIVKQGFRTVIGGVSLPNPASVRLHESVGFEPIGVYREVGRKFGKWHDVGFWQKMIPENANAPEIRPLEDVLNELNVLR